MSDVLSTPHRSRLRPIFVVMVLALFGTFLAASPAQATDPITGNMKIQDLYSHLCLSPAGGSSALNATIVQYSCDGLLPRTWNLVWDNNVRAYQIKNYYNHLCLSPAGGSTGLNVVIVQYTCDGDASRYWDLPQGYGSLGNAPSLLRNHQSNLCLSPAGGSTDLNAAIVQYTCDGDPARVWDILSAKIIANTNSGGYCLTIAGSSNTLNAVAVSYYCDRMAPRLWNLVSIGAEGSTNYFLENLATGWCLSPAGAATGQNTLIVQYYCDSNPARAWRLLPAAGGSKIQNLGTGLCLTPAGGGTGINNAMVQYACDNDPSRIWSVRKST